MLCWLEVSWIVIAVSETLTKVPVYFFEAVSMTWMVCPGCKPLNFDQDDGVDCETETEVQESTRAQNSKSSFCIRHRFLYGRKYTTAEDICSEVFAYTRERAILCN